MDSTYEAFQAWHTQRTVRRKGRPPSEKTLVGYTMRCRGAQRIGGCETAQHLAICLGSRSRVVQLLDGLWAQQKPVTVMGTVQALRLFGDFAVAAGLIDTNEVKVSDAPTHSPQKPIQVLSEADLDKLLVYAHARNLRLWMLMATLAETGRRIGEMLKLRWENVLLDVEPPHFDLPDTKSRRQQYVPLTRTLREEVWTLSNIEQLKAGVASTASMGRSVTEYPFPWSHKGAYHHLDKLTEAAGVTCDGFHLLRHTRATRLLERGVPLHVVSTLLGHASTAVTERVYAHADALAYTQYLD